MGSRFTSCFRHGFLRPSPAASVEFEGSRQQDVNDGVRAIGLVHQRLSSCRGQSDEILVFNGHPPTIGKMNEKRTKRLRMKQLANFINLHPK